MQILVINSGSTSLKYKLFNAENYQVYKENYFQNITNHEIAFKQTLREIGDLREVEALGHRVVHGGREFTEPTLINEEILKRLEKFNNLAPLHNPYNLAGIKASREYLPRLPNVAVFDTAFFKNLPRVTKVYALPLEYYEKYGIERFGFHGISHKYVASQAAERLARPLHKLKLITCHLGGGASITAIDQGQPVDTSMGFTPLEGLVMMTRSGDVDPGIIIQILEASIKKHQNFCQEEFYKIKEDLDQLLNHQSGIKGLSGLGDFLTLIKEMSLGNEKAKLAFDIFVYRIKKYIGAYFAILGGLDGLVFTGAIGAGNPLTRKKVCAGLKFLEKVEVMAIPTNEELQIAKEVKELVAAGSDEN